MKARIAALAAVASLALAGTALAEEIETPVGTLTVDAEAAYVLADGSSSNEDPADGYIEISLADGKGCASDQGSPDDSDGDGETNDVDTDDDGDGVEDESDDTNDAAATCAP